MRLYNHDRVEARKASQRVRKILATQLKTVVTIFDLKNSVNDTVRKQAQDILRIDMNKPITGNVWNSLIDFYLDHRSFFFVRKSVIFQAVGKDFFSYYDLWVNETPFDD